MNYLYSEPSQQFCQEELGRVLPNVNIGCGGSRYNVLTLYVRIHDSELQTLDSYPVYRDSFENSMQAAQRYYCEYRGTL